MEISLIPFVKYKKIPQIAADMPEYSKTAHF
jgi:hypothetical protein